MKKESKILIIVAIIVLAAGLRFYGADRTLINDEVTWAETAQNLAATGEPLQYVQCGSPSYFYWHPPFGRIAYSFATGLFGFGNFAFRLLPIIFGVVTVAATYFLGRELYSEKTGIIAAVLMALSHYHILYSQNVDVDGGFLAFFNVASVLFFVMHKKYGGRYLYLSLIFLALSIFTKFSGFLPIFAMLAYSYFADRKNIKKDAAVLIATSALSIIPIFLYALATGDMNYFTGPLDYALFTIFERTGQRTMEQIVFNKAFYLSTVTWMLTPFLTMLFLLALRRVKKDKNYALLAAWSVITYAAFFVSFNLDIQRYYAAALAPVFILTAKLLADRVKFKKSGLMLIAATAAIAGTAAFAFNINDLQGYHNPLLLGFVYLIAVAIAIVPLRLLKTYKMPLLAGAFVGLSLYFVFSASSWHAIQSETVDKLAQNADEFGFDYKNVWGNKDVEYALTPQGELLQYCFPEPDKEFLEKNNVRYISVYHFRNEEGLKSVAESCIRKEEVYVNGHLVGLTCELGYSNANSIGVKK